MQTVRDHLISRHLDLNLHQPMIDEVDRVATFYLYNLSNQIVGYQMYRPDADKVKNNHPKEGRYFTYRNKETLGVWGLESLHLTPNVIFITEGVFDAARIISMGYSAVATLSNNPQSDFKNWLGFLNRKVVAVCDNDSAGRKLAKFGDVAVFTEDKDLGDSSDEFVCNLLKEYGNAALG